MRYAAPGALLAALMVIACQDPPQEEPERIGSSDENAIAIPAPDPPPIEPRVLEAISEATEAVVSDPDSARAWGTLGMVFDAHTYYQQALRCYRQALRLAPDDFRWNYYLAIALEHEAGDIEEVVGLFEKAAEAEPRYPPLHYLWAPLFGSTVETSRPARPSSALWSWIPSWQLPGYSSARSSWRLGKPGLRSRSSNEPSR